MPTIRGALAHARRCATEIDEGAFDVCLAGTCQIFAAPPLARFVRTPSVLYLQEPSRWLYEANPSYPWLAATRARAGARGAPAAAVRSFLAQLRIYRRSQRARFECDNAHAFDAVLVNSLFSREAVVRIYGIDASVCYLGVDGDRFTPARVGREDMVVGVGHVASHKNLHLLVEAVAGIQAPRPRVEWVGATADRSYLRTVREAARASGVDLVVHLASSDELLVDRLRRAFALVYTPRLEPFGLVPLEANACATPVIAVAEGGIRETIADGANGVLVERTARDIAAAIERLRADPKLVERLGAEGRRIVEERWTQRSATDRLLTALERVRTSRAERRAT